MLSEEQRLKDKISSLEFEILKHKILELEKIILDFNAITKENNVITYEFPSCKFSVDTSNWRVQQPINIIQDNSNEFSIVTDTTQKIAKNGKYIPTSLDQTTFYLPPSGMDAGSTFRIAGFGIGGWRIAQTAGQSIYLGPQFTTVGVDGEISSTSSKDSVEVVCVVANTTFSIVSYFSPGNISII